MLRWGWGVQGLCSTARGVWLLTEIVSFSSLYGSAAIHATNFLIGSDHQEKIVAGFVYLKIGFDLCVCKRFFRC